MAQRGVVEQRMDGCRPRVAGPNAVAAAGFELVQERADQRRVQVSDVQPGGRLAGLLGGEGQRSLIASR
jgi:hypothetical protein